ncbi:MAG TPA: thiamine pyrophosphate-dependent enzyme, partial [Solirubrobacterales bacterium]|nr:thiamine pyrophosphate-dependent enzyme [Solirubrobacterales bacterium]
SERAVIVSAYDLILRDAATREHLEPDFVLRIGELPTSKPLRTWLTDLDCPQVVLDPRGVWREPTRVAERVIVADPAATVETASRMIEMPLTVPSWTSAWRIIELAAQSAADETLSDVPYPFEPAVYRDLLRNLKGGATIFVSSSMPVRDVETYAVPGRFDVRFLSNRGANGIDGVVSSALGAAVPYGCDRVILLTGDLTVLHDVGALSLIKRHGIDITIVCVDNDGGGIFSFLPVAGYQSHFEDKIATPSGVDLERVAKAFGLEYVTPAHPEQLLEAVEKPGFVHLQTNREQNKVEHDRVAKAVLRSVAAALAESGAAR